MLRGFTKPTTRITKDLQREGLAPMNLTPMLDPRYGGGVLALRFVIPPEVADILGRSESDAVDE